MRSVLEVILNRSYSKFGMENGRGRTYEALLTVGSIRRAQAYYELLQKVIAGEDELKISEDVKKAVPDFPKAAITYSLSENEEESKENQDRMKAFLKDYNEMFGTRYGVDNIQAYNANLNERLARKETKYKSRDQQLDLVIVVDRLLTGFDAPCLSTLFIDRQPLNPQNLIQAFSRTNRLFDDKKQYGQVVTFQAHDQYKRLIDYALRLYSRGGEGNPISEDFDDVKKSFGISLKAVRNLARTPEDIAGLSRKQKGAFIHLFRSLDHDFAHLKAFSVSRDSMRSFAAKNPARPRESLRLREAMRIAMRRQEKTTGLSTGGFYMSCKSIVALVLVLAGGLGFLTALDAGALVVLLLAKVGQNAGLCAAALESLQRVIQRLVFLDVDFRHVFPSLQIRLAAL